jgi:hypothetical protein
MAADTTAGAFKLEDDVSTLYIQTVTNGVGLSLYSKRTGQGYGVVLQGLEPGQVADALRHAARQVTRRDS